MSSISDGEAFRAVRRFFAGRFAVGIWRVSMDVGLFTDQLTLTQSERRRVTGVEEDESTGSSLRWFASLVRLPALRPSPVCRSEEAP